MPEQTTVRNFIALGDTVSLAISGASVSVTLPSVNRPLNPEMPLSVRVWNAGSVAMTWCEGSPATALHTYVMPPGACEVFALTGNSLTLSAINTSGSTATTMYFTPGQGS